MRYRSVWRILGLSAAIVTGPYLDTIPARAQEEIPATLDGAIAALYTGDCDDGLIDPLGELGDLEYRRVVDFYDSQTTTGAEAPRPDDVGYLDEDVNGNDVLDEGEDLNDNGVLDAGIDINASDTLDDDEIIPESALMIRNIPEVWMLERELGSDIIDLLDEGYVIAVLQGEGEDQRIIACGGPGDFPDEESSFFNLVPVGDATYRGYARLLLGEDVDDKDFHVVMFETLLQDDEDEQG